MTAATGGAVTTVTDGATDYTVHTFTSSGTLTFSEGGSDVEYLVVAGGGGGGISEFESGGGGGAGGVIQGGSGSPITVTASAYSITVGAGGAGGQPGVSGSDSVVSGTGVSLTAVGGGKGGSDRGANPPGVGGSGGGAAPQDAGGGAAGTAGQGFAGGDGSGGSSQHSGSGGGGGASAAGGAGTGENPGFGGDGGDGITSTIDGTSRDVAGGGGGSGSSAVSGSQPGNGGLGGGGDGGENGSDGLANTGGGGGAGRRLVNGTSAGSGGSGIVIVRYPVAGGGAAVDLAVDSLAASPAVSSPSVSALATLSLDVLNAAPAVQSFALGTMVALTVDSLAVGPSATSPVIFNSEDTFLVGEVSPVETWNSGANSSFAPGMVILKATATTTGSATHVWCSFSSNPGQYQAAIYSAAGALLGTSAIQSAGATGDTEIELSSPVSITSGTEYWIGIAHEFSGSRVRFASDESAGYSTDEANAAVTLGSLPDPVTSQSVSANTLGVYAFQRGAGPASLAIESASVAPAVQEPAASPVTALSLDAASVGPAVDQPTILGGLTLLIDAAGVGPGVASPTLTINALPLVLDSASVVPAVSSPFIEGDELGPPTVLNGPFTARSGDQITIEVGNMPPGSVVSSVTYGGTGVAVDAQSQVGSVVSVTITVPDWVSAGLRFGAEHDIGVQFSA